MFKRVIVAVVLCMMLSFNFAYGAEFVDVSDGFWAKENIYEVNRLKIMEGMGNNKFGVGESLTRAQFVTMLSRLFEWNVTDQKNSAFKDNEDASKWYYNYVETAVTHGAVKNDAQYFRPDDNITRSEMAVMLVRALGYDSLAQGAASFGNKFTDVKSDVGYINVASDFGIITGKNANTFAPNSYATREEAATMMMRLHKNYNSKIDKIHGFYAISSWGQKDLIQNMDEVTFGWSRMELDANSNVVLNTTAANNNDWKIPTGYMDAVNVCKQSNTDTKLGIQMNAEQKITKSDGSTSKICNEILLNSQNRTKAVKLIIGELTKNYDGADGNIYTGVTIDFEGMKGSELKSGFTAFLKELKDELGRINKTLYVAVHPKWKNNMPYYDAYDYKAIGAVSDKVILMAHDYQANTLTQAEMDMNFTTTPLTPFEDVYYALKAITDKDTGVSDKNKIALAFSFGTVGWHTKDGKVTNGQSFKPSVDFIHEKLLNPDTKMNYSNKYRNPYITYYNSETQTDDIVWYEDSRSIADKINLAEMFGIKNISIWRIGTVPNYADGYAATYYNIWDEIVKEK